MSNGDERFRRLGVEQAELVELTWFHVAVAERWCHDNGQSFPDLLRSVLEVVGRHATFVDPVDVELRHARWDHPDPAGVVGSGRPAPPGGRRLTPRWRVSGPTGFCLLRGRELTAASHDLAPPRAGGRGLTAF